MKQYIKIFALTALATGIAACTEGPDEAALGSQVDMTVRASFGALTKAELDPDTYQVSWELGDRISLLYGTENFAFTGKTAGHVSEFTGKALQIPAKDHYIAVYPYSEDYSLEGRSFNINLPSLVSPVPDSFSGAVGTALVSGAEAVFKHATGYISFQVTRNDINHVIIRSGNGEALSGTFKVTLNADGSSSMEAVEGDDELLINTQMIAGTYYVPLPPRGYNGFNISLKSSEGVADSFIEKYPKVTAGKVYELGPVDENPEWKSTEAPVVKEIRATSSTAAVTWSISDFASVSHDVTENWSVGIYNDEACEDLIVSWDTPASLFTQPEGTILNIGGPYSPRFIFTGLEAGKDHYVKVWYTERPQYASQPLKVTTMASEVVKMPAGPAKAGDVILCEDFSELVWGGDLTTRSTGHSDNNRSKVSVMHAAKGENPVGKQTVDDIEHDYCLVNPTINIGLFNTLKTSLTNTRLSAWSTISEDNKDNRVCAMAGMVRLGAESKTGGIVSPQLSALEGKALLKVSFKGCPVKYLVNDPLFASVMVISTETEGRVISDYKVKSKVDFTFDSALEWKEYECEILADPTDRIAVSSRRVSGSGEQRILIDDIKVEVVKAYSGVKVTEIQDANDLQSFLFYADKYTAEETVTIADDIDLEGVELISGSSFKGTLDGGGHRLKNWTSDATPLFTTFAGTVKNIVIDESCQLTPATDGGRFGFITNDIGRFGRLENCTNNADITLNAETVGQLYFGSLAGVSYGTISGCTNNGDITFVVSGNVSANGCIGGIAGYANVSDQYKEKGEGYDIAFENCVNNGNLSYTVNGTVKYLTFGGIAGGTSYAAIASESFRGTAKNCVNTGNLSYTFKNGGSLEDNAGSAGSGNFTNIGGVFGYWAGNIENCTNGVQGDATKGGVSLVFPTSDASACATRPAVGGVCAFVLQNMTGCNNYGKVYMKGSAAGGDAKNAGCGLIGEVTTGGIVAQIGPASNAADYKLSNCHNHGEVDIRAWMASGNGTGFDLGGAVGYCGVPVENVSNNGKVTIESKGAYVRAGGVIGKAAYAAASLTNNGEVSIKGIRTSGSKQIGSELHFGGVVGYSTGELTAAVNNKPCSFKVETIDSSAELRTGGVVGGSAAKVTGTNNGAVTMVPGGKAVMIVGGVAGWTGTAIEYADCINTCAVTAKSDVKISNQLFVSGIVGRVTKSASVNKCTNSGTVSIDIPQGTSDTANANLSGITSSSDQNQTITGCTNTGDLVSNMPCNAMRVGGIAGYNGGGSKCTGCSADCDITLSAAVTTMNVGGMVGYSNPGKYIDCSYKGKISVTSGGYIGGVLGYTKTNQTMEGCKVGAEITYGANTYAGLFIGSSDAGKTYTLGTTEKPCQVVSGSKVGSTTVTALDDATDAAGVLVGRKNAVTVNAVNTSVVTE